MIAFPAGICSEWRFRITITGSHQEQYFDSLRFPDLEQEATKDKKEEHTPSLRWAASEGRHGRAVPIPACPQAKVGIAPQPAAITVQLCFTLGCQKKRVFNKLELRKESSHERGISYKGQSGVAED